MLVCVSLALIVGRRMHGDNAVYRKVDGNRVNSGTQLFSVADYIKLFHSRTNTPGHLNYIGREMRFDEHESDILIFNVYALLVARGGDKKLNVIRQASIAGNIPVQLFHFICGFLANNFLPVIG